FRHAFDNSEAFPSCAVGRDHSGERRNGGGGQGSLHPVDRSSERAAAAGIRLGVERNHSGSKGFAVLPTILSRLGEWRGGTRSEPGDRGNRIDPLRGGGVCGPVLGPCRCKTERGRPGGHSSEK